MYVKKQPARPVAGALARIIVVLALSIGGAAAVVGGYWFVKIRPRMLALQDPHYGSEPGRAKKLPETRTVSADFDLGLQLPGRPHGVASNEREILVASGGQPFSALRIERDGRRYTSQTVPIVETGSRQSIGLDTLTWNGLNYVGYTTGSWFGKQGDVFTVHDPKTLRILTTHAAPPHLGGLAWDGAHYWSSTRKNTEDAPEEAFFYKIDPHFQVVARSKPPGIGCQGLAWDGSHLWYVDVFSDSIKVLDVSGPEPIVIHDASTPINYLSGVVFHQNAIWVVDYGENRLHRLRNSTRVAWAGSSPPPVAAAAIVPQPVAARSVLSGQYRNRFIDREQDEAEVLEWSVELRDGGVWLTSARLWFGPELFVPRTQNATVVTIPVFARYTFTVKLPDGSKVEKQFDAVSGDNELSQVRLADAIGPGTYSVSTFLHVQYVDAAGTGRILNYSGGFVELTK